MPEHQLHPELQTLCDKLDSIAQAVLNGTSDNRTMLEIYGWNCPAVNRHGLSRFATDLAAMIRDRAPETLDEPILKIVKEAQGNLESLRPTTIQQIYGGNSGIATSVYITTISSLRSDLEPLLGWHSIRDANLIPAKMAKRIRNYQAALDQIAPNKDELKRRIELINSATDAAESLPTDLEELALARKQIETAKTESLLQLEKIKESFNQAAASCVVIKDNQVETARLVKQCEDAYRITTTKGLAAAFTQRARTLTISMWVWVGGLVGALVAGYFLGSDRLKELTDLLNNAQKQPATIWPTAILALFSIGAPVWLAWVATKQIGQRFRLAEDYGFKASVAKAYEGYRKEAARIDKNLETRLFESALTRLEEAPLRLVESKTPGSPWHEFIESEGFHEALNKIPGFRGEFNTFRKKLGKAIAGDAQETHPDQGKPNK